MDDKKTIIKNPLIIGTISTIIGGLFIYVVASIINLGNRVSYLEGKVEIIPELINNLKAVEERLVKMRKDIRPINPNISERTLDLSPAPNSLGKRIEGSSGRVVFYDNSDGTFSGRIELFGLRPNHTYVLTLNGKPPHPSNNLLPEGQSRENYFHFLQVITNSVGNIEEQEFNARLPAGDYSVRFFVKDRSDWKIVLFNDLLTFKVN